MTIDYARARELMVEQQVRPWDVLDMDVLEVIGRQGLSKVGLVTQPPK